MSALGPLYCYCRKGEKGFMIQCDGCEQWFHGVCVGVNKPTGHQLSQWFCGFCFGWKKRHDELQSQVTTLAKKLDDLKDEDELQKQLQKGKAEAHMANSELDDTKKKLRQLQEEFGIISKDKDELQKQLLLLEPVIQNAKEENLNLTSQLNKANEKIELLLIKLEQATRRKKLSLSQH